MGLLGGVVQPAVAVRRLRHARGTTLRGILPFLPLSGYVKFYNILRHRVVDPYSFFPNPDPDPEFEVGDQYGSGFGSGSNTDPGL